MRVKFTHAIRDTIRVWIHKIHTHNSGTWRGLRRGAGGKGGGGGLRRGAEGLEKTENGLVIQPENEPETLVNMKRFQKKSLEIQPAECLSQEAQVADHVS